MLGLGSPLHQDSPNQAFITPCPRRPALLCSLGPPLPHLKQQHVHDVFCNTAQDCGSLQHCRAESRSLLGFAAQFRDGSQKGPSSPTQCKPVWHTECFVSQSALPLPPPPHTHTQLLVREPYGVVQSFSKGLQPTLLELGYGVSA